MTGIEAYFTIELVVTDPTGVPVDRDHLDSQSDGVMEHLIALSETDCAIADPAVSVDFAASEVTIELVVAGETFEAAETVMLSAVRASIHAVGGATPNWHTHAKTGELLTPA